MEEVGDFVPQALYHWEMGFGTNCIEQRWLSRRSWYPEQDAQNEVVRQWRNRTGGLTVAIPLTTADWFCLFVWFGFSSVAMIRALWRENKDPQCDF